MHDLLLRGCQLAEWATYVELGTDLGEHRVCAFGQLASLDESALRRKRSETKILGDREIAAERQLLVHHADARGERVTRSGECDLTSVEEQPSAIRCVDAGEDFSERAFAGAILTAQRVTRPSRDLERDVVQRLHTRKALRDAVEANGRHLAHSTLVTASAANRRVERS